MQGTGAILVLVAVLDANVLYPAPLRDFLLSLAEYALFQPRWTEQIQGEWINNLLGNRQDLTRQRLERTVRLMDEAFPRARVTNYQRHVRKLQLPDPGDRHVLAAAIEAGAQVIVTWNLHDFPAEALAPWQVEALCPDAFAERLWDEDSELFCQAVSAHRARLRNPPRTPTEYLDTLQQQGLTQTVQLLRPWIQRL